MIWRPKERRIIYPKTGARPVLMSSQNLIRLWTTSKRCSASIASSSNSSLKKRAAKLRANSLLSITTPKAASSRLTAQNSVPVHTRFPSTLKIWNFKAMPNSFSPSKLQAPFSGLSNTITGIKTTAYSSVWEAYRRVRADDLSADFRTNCEFRSMLLLTATLMDISTFIEH